MNQEQSSEPRRARAIRFLAVGGVIFGLLQGILTSALFSESDWGRAGYWVFIIGYAIVGGLVLGLVGRRLLRR